MEDPKKKKAPQREPNNPQIDYKVVREFLGIMNSYCGSNEEIVIAEFYQNKRKFHSYSENPNLNPKANIYYTVNPRLVTRNSKGQGTKDDVKHIIAFYADLDVRSQIHHSGGFDSKEEALEQLEEFLTPTFIIDTGYGIQALWLLKEPLTIGEDIEIEEYEAINRGLQIRLKADTTADITRLLRLPGTYNNKIPESPQIVKIIQKTDITYNLSDFEIIQPVYSHNGKNYEINTDLKNAKSVDLSRLSNRIKSIIYFGRDPENPTKTDRSELIQSVITAMISKNYTDDEIYTVLTTKEYGISEKIREMKTESRKKHFIGFSISKAKAYLEASKQENSNEDNLPFRVLGYTKDRKIYIWFHGELIDLDVQRLSRNILMLFVGDLDPDRFKQMKETIILTAHKKGLINIEDKISMGIFKFGDEFVINTGKHSLKVDGDTITVLEEPVYDKKIIVFEKESFLDIEKLVEEYKNADITATFSELLEYISQWNFQCGEMGKYMTAFVMLAPFQQAMNWRPWIYLTGRRGTGKTTFFDEVLGIYGPLTIRKDKTTAHALVQLIGNTGRIPILDEFEKNKKIDEILELAKSASKGGYYTRGTTGDNPREWHLHHIVWFGSILPAGNDAAQYSRTIYFELLPPTNNQPKFWTSKEKFELRHRIIASVLKNWKEIEEKAEEYQRNKSKYEVQDGRIIDNFAYAAALIDVATGEGGIPEFAGKISFEEDEEKLLRTILSSLKEGKTMYEHLKDHAERLCENYGLKITKHNNKKYLAIYPDQVRRYLLNDTIWRDLGITPLLKRLSDSDTTVSVKMKGKSRRAILIPLEMVESIMEE